MPQETNLNVAPYFDDFEANKNYYKVLFKPGYPIQARELTTLQSILQNQIEKFGDHIFKEGAKVIPGNTSYNRYYSAVELNNSFAGLNVEDYLPLLVGKKIKGEITGITALVDKVLLPNESERDNATIYVSYLTASTTDSDSKVFVDDENLLIQETIISGSIAFFEGEALATTIANNATSVASSFTVSDGVYYLRGYFVNVETQTIILDQYSNNPDYKIGFTIVEEIINSDIDDTLTDNAQGFNNYAAPGADRLKITAILDKKLLDDTSAENFVEIAQIQGGIVRNVPNDTLYNLINDKFAKRTYEESGDYYVNRFETSCVESLDNGLGNNGIFSEGETTYQGNPASENLAIYKVSPGKAYIRGYDVEINSPTFLDIEKPRTTTNSGNQSIVYYTGPSFALNRVQGIPTIGIGNTYTISLRDQRIGIVSSTAAGDEIGLARVFDFALEEGSYQTVLDTNRWDISLYDIQTYTKITLNENVTLDVPTYVVGNSSGATGFLKDSVTNSKSLVLYNVTGKFVEGESFTFDGIKNSRVSVATTSYEVSDVKSMYGIDSTYVFNADTVQSNSLFVGVSSITEHSSNQSTIIIPNLNFTTAFKVGNLVRFTNPSVSANGPTIARVLSFTNSSTSTSVAVAGVTTVTGVCDGKLPSTLTSLTDLTILKTDLLPSTDNTLFTALSNQNVESVDLTDAFLTIRKQFTVNITSNSTNVVTAGTNETFLPYDEERYSLIRSDGLIEPLSTDKVQISADGTTLQIRGLGTNNTGASLVATLRKIKVKSKVKRKNRVNSIIVNKSTLSSSGTGTTTRDDGLTFGNYPYGTRVQDDVISLNVPDVLRVHGVFESLGNSNASSPTMTITISSASGTTDDLIIGEKIVGRTSGSIAICAEKLTSNKISFINNNASSFNIGETLDFKESGATAIISTIETTSKNITNSFTYDNGQRDTFYDYGRIIRKLNSVSPQRNIKIYFENAYYETQDDGDVTTASSYQLFNYKDDVAYHNGVRNTDIIDIRPRVSSYTVSESARSPFEFEGRSFSQSGNSSANILASDESIFLNYNFYLPRIDRIFVNKDGKFIVQKGTPAEQPSLPSAVDDSIEIATVSLSPYLYSTSQASITTFDYKRYQMSDIAKLETRIKNLEYYTTLSLLETDTANLFVPDSNGLNRFKSGFFVDNFADLTKQDPKIGIKGSIDPLKGEFRPSHYTNSVDLVVGTKGLIGAGATTNEDIQNLDTKDILGTNIAKTGDIVTLSYTNREWLSQPYATISENVQPYVLSFWEGSIQLNPSSDIWVDTVRLAAKTVQLEGNYLSTLNSLALTNGVNPQTGIGPVIWGSWALTGFSKSWVDARTPSGGGNNATQSVRNNFFAWRQARGLGAMGQGDPNWQGGSPDAFRTGVIPTTGLYVETLTKDYVRTGTKTIVTPVFDTKSLGDSVVSVDVIPFMRSRNIEFRANNFKPFARIYAFFDGKAVSQFCFPKLLQIQMSSGTFQVGETVEIQTLTNSQSIVDGAFRVAVANHRSGKYNEPTDVFIINPYNNQTLPTNYSSTSTILNVDTSSLSLKSETNYYGLIRTGYRLVGKSSGAIATVTNIILKADDVGTIIGSFFIPDPNKPENPKFEAGIRTFKLTSVANNNPTDLGEARTEGEEKFFAEGKKQTIQETILSIRNARVETQSFTDTKQETEFTGLYIDPLAQSFACDDPTGVFLTKVDVFFKNKDPGLPVRCQIRTMDLGTPTKDILPFSEVSLNPDQVNVSEDGTVATTFTFESPVYIEGQQEYAIVLLSNSTSYRVWISRLGQVDITTANRPTSQQKRVETQPTLGSLFKSQNASTWSPSQFEDLKFTLYRANFSTTLGNINFFNPPLTESNSQIPTLTSDPLTLISRRARISLGSTIDDSGLQVGNTVLQTSSNATGVYVGAVGLATGNLTIVNAGVGYTPSAGDYNFTGVALTSLTGTGRNATANISIENGVAIAATILSGGFGYQVGDVLTVQQIGNEELGRNLQLSVGIVSAFNEIILDNIQGEFREGTGIGNSISYTNSSGVTTALNAATGGNVTIPLGGVQIEQDGQHFVVVHLNHGMHSDLNYVTISNAGSDIEPGVTNSTITATYTGALSITNSSNFSTFERVSVSSTNPGYALIENEIVKYTSVGGGSINIVARGVDGTSATDHAINSQIYKYELNGVSLLRINKTHTLQDSDITTLPPPFPPNDDIGLDYYTVKIDQSGSTVGTKQIVNRSISQTSFPLLYFADTKTDGGNKVKATQNMPYEVLTPLIETFIPNSTDITAQVRTVSGKSISGTETPFVDQGYESVTLGAFNYFNTPRIITSNINSSTYLTDLPAQKSLNILLTLSTLDPRLSPVVDLARTSIITTTNRVNKIIANVDYSTDNSVNSLYTDPNAFIYVSKQIGITNPATSIKLYVSADINTYCDIRALYAINNNEQEEPVFELFPGFNNLNNLGETIDVASSDGTPDQPVPQNTALTFDNSTFTEYEFTANELPSFKYYRIKLIMTSTNQSYVPKVKDLRAIVLAWYGYERPNTN